jgi:FkbM family methyltransferase
MADGSGTTARDGTDWKQKAGELRARADRLHRSVLEPDVLQRSLLVRAGTLASRTALPDVRARERRFREASAAYAEAIGGEAAIPDGMRRIAVDGLTWWVPLMRPDDPLLVGRAIAQQDFPYRVIAQTREVAIGGAMIDVGANVGRMSVPRVILGDVSVAYCAEPDPLNYACLMRNVRDNGLGGLMLPDRVAIGDRSGTVRFERSKTAGGHRVVDSDRVTAHETITVPLVTLDEWVERVGIDLDHVTFVKADVQGSEVRVLNGAARVLSSRHIAWQIEVDPQLLRRGGSSAAELLSLLQRHFTHFIDLNPNAAGARVRPVAELQDALGYITGSPEGRTDVLVCTLTA